MQPQQASHGEKKEQEKDQGLSSVLIVDTCSLSIHSSSFVFYYVFYYYCYRCVFIRCNVFYYYLVVLCRDQYMASCLDIFLRC